MDDHSIAVLSVVVTETGGVWVCPKRECILISDEFMDCKFKLTDKSSNLSL